MKSLNCLIFLSILSFSLFAQGDENLDSLMQMYDLEDVVVTAQYAPTSSNNAVHQVKVIKSEEIERQGLINLSEVLQNQLNLRVSTDPILGNGLKIQGIGGENIQIMIDGVPVIGRVGGDIDLSQINMNNVQQIEIIEGAMSAQYGSNAAGGVVNIITKKSQLDKVQVKTSSQYESIGIWNNSLGLSMQSKRLFAGVNYTNNIYKFAPNDSMRVQKTVKLPNDESYKTKKIPWNPKKQNGIDATLRFSPTDSFNLTYQYRFFDEDLRRLGEVRRPQFKPYAFDEIYTTNRVDHSLTADAYFSENLYFKSTTSYNVYDREKEVQRLDFEEDTIGNIIPEQDTTSFTAFLHRSILSTVSKGKFNGQFGLEILHETGIGKRIVDSTSLPINQAVLTNYAAWLGLRFQPNKKMTFSGNLRYGYNSKYKHPVIPAFHFDYKINRKWRTKLSYAHGFRAPSLKELHFNFVDINHNIIGNPNLLPENSRNASASLTYTDKSDAQKGFYTTLKFFHNYIENRITIAEYAELKFNYQNLDEYQTHGANLQAEYQFEKMLKIKSGFAYTRLLSTLSEEVGEDKFVPLSEWQNEVLWTEEYSNISFNLTHRFIGKQVRFYTDADGNLAQGSIGNYHLVNATLSRHFIEKRIFVAFGTKNLTDTQTVPVLGSSGEAHSSAGNSQLLNWGRTWFLRLNFRF